MATSYDPNNLHGYRWIFVSLKADETDKIHDLISRNFICLNGNKNTFFGAKGNSDVKGNNITVDYDTILRENIRGELNSAHIQELENLFGQLGLKGGKRKSSKSRKSRKNRKTKSRKGKSRKSTSRKK
jgi:hypothetical protein